MGKFDYLSLTADSYFNYKMYKNVLNLARALTPGYLTAVYISYSDVTTI